MTIKTLIVSVYYNRADMVDASVSSVVQQLDDGMHLLLVDDGSPDNTLAKLRQWEGARVSVMTHANMGFVDSIRKGIESIPSEYIAIHGSGDESLPGRFRKQADYLDQHPRIGVVGCFSRCVYSTNEMPPFIEGKRFTGDASRFILSGNLFHQGEVMMRRDCYEQVGGYRNYFKFAQDRDLFCRMSQVTHFHVIEEVLYTKYVGVPGSVSGTAKKVLMQRFLSDFACWCHAQRLAGKKDPLDEFGPRAALLWSPSARIKGEIFRRAVRAHHLQRPEDYRVYRDALLQKDLRPTQRLFFAIAEGFPALTAYVLNAYYRNKQTPTEVSV